MGVRIRREFETERNNSSIIEGKKNYIHT